jgi:tight adherence protein B
VTRLFGAVPVIVIALAAAAMASAQGGTATDVQLTPVGRLPFPARGFIADLPATVRVVPGAISVTENGRPVRNLDVSPIGRAGIHFGVVLALDASESMTGDPLAAAFAAARSFAARLEQGQQLGVVTFNDRVRVVQRPTADARLLTQGLAGPPPVAYGTRLYDAVERSLAVLGKARLSTGSIVLLSDGADIGSRRRLDDVIAHARARHVRVFTVGLRSRAFDSQPLRRLAAETGAAYAEASSAAGLKSVYDSLQERIASEYLIRYRSDAAPKSDVQVAVSIRDVGTATKRYTAPTPSGLLPFHRSLLSRFVLSPGAVGLLGLLVAAFAALAIMSFLRPRPNTVVDRVEAFAGGRTHTRVEDVKRVAGELARRSRHPGGWFGRLEHRLEVARIDMPAGRVVLLTAAATVLVVVVLALLSPVFAILGLATPLMTRSLITRKLKQVRDEFADQLPPNLQVLASALRVGHSFIGALTVVVENAHEPSHSELRRVLTDEQLGVPVDEAIQRVAVRMKSRDLEQVALLAELQRTAGGNAAEVLDTVVETLRERADLRRLVRTLTAQGRMARWILTSLPIFVGFFMLIFRNELMRPLYQSGGGQVAIVLATTMVIAGSVFIQRIVDIEV